MNERPAGWRARLPVLIPTAALVIVAALVIHHFVTRPPKTMPVPTAPVARQDISQTVEATGTVQAVEVVEIKSKASGQVTKMPVAIGSVVKAGDLLAQIDPLTVRNQYNQLLAALQAAQANVTVTSAQKKRADQLFTQEVITAVDHEAAQLAAANAQASLAKARADLVIARQALDDATVRAPSAGTIIEQDATQGMVITSATSSASGGTTLFKMADLGKIQIQALVGETDVGNLQPGMPARVSVDAFPNRSFPGNVIKIEPQAVVQQSVTMFPVLVSIENVNQQLLPGMNGQVTIGIADRSQVLAVPLDAVRSVRELPTVAAALGLNPDTLRAQVQRQVQARPTGGVAANEASGMAGASDSARAARRARWQGGGGRGAGGGGFGGNRGAGGGFAGNGPGGGMGGGGMGGGGGGRAQVVMVQTDHGFEPRLVRLGISNFDYAEILSGVQEGEQVALLGAAEQAAKRRQQQAQIAQRVGNGLPGSGATGGGGGGNRGGGGGGGGR